jgi:hypothetical protein
MVVGSLKTERAARSLGPSVGWPLVQKVDARRRTNFPFWGKRLCARNDALRAPIGSSGHARPFPLGYGRSPPYLPLVTGAPGAPWFLARRSYLRPGPTALHSYRAPRREDKSETEATVWSKILLAVPPHWHSRVASAGRPEWARVRDRTVQRPTGS